MKTISILLTLSILFQSCKEKAIENKTASEIEKNTKNEITESLNLNNKSESEPKVDLSFLNNIKEVNLPHRDSTNFDNHKVGKLLTKEQIERLSLNKVFEIHSNAYNAHKIGINKRNF